MSTRLKTKPKAANQLVLAAIGEVLFEFLLQRRKAPKKKASLDLDFQQLSFWEKVSHFTETEVDKLVPLKEQGKPATVEEALQQFEALIRAFARRFARHIPGAEENDLVSDLIQEGNWGVWQAFEKFEENRNCSFATYAVRRLRWRMIGWVMENYKIKTVPLDAEDADGNTLAECIADPQPGLSIYDRVLLDEIWRAVQKLPGIFAMLFISGSSWA